MKMTQSNIGMACCREGGDTGILCSVANFTPHLIQAESLTLVAEIALGFLVANVRLRPIGPDRNAQDAPHGLRLVGFCALRSSSQAHWGMKGRDKMIELVACKTLWSICPLGVHNSFRLL